MYGYLINEDAFNRNLRHTASAKAITFRALLSSLTQEPLRKKRSQGERSGIMEGINMAHEMDVVS